MEILVLIFVIVLLCLGFLSCFINKIPGPLFVVIAVLTAQLGMDTAPGWGAVAIVTVIAIAAFVLSKYMTRIAKKNEGIQQESKHCHHNRIAAWCLFIACIC